jgi:hypothetical protein
VKKAHLYKTFIRLLLSFYSCCKVAELLIHTLAIVYYRNLCLDLFNNLLLVSRYPLIHMKYPESNNVLEFFERVLLGVSFRDNNSEYNYTLRVTLQVVIC